MAGNERLVEAGEGNGGAGFLIRALRVIRGLRSSAVAWWKKAWGSAPPAEGEIIGDKNVRRSECAVWVSGNEIGPMG